MSAPILSHWRKRLASPLAWRIALVAALSLLVLALGVRFALDWSAAGDSAASALASKQFQWRALEMQNQSLRGLDQRVDETRRQILDFYQRRIPANYSVIAARIGDLQVRTGARLSRVQYSQQPVSADLAEIVLDVSLSGDYKQIMRFVNGLEREQSFFVVRAMALNEQQGGMVNLRLRLSTWLRPADAAAAPPPAPVENKGKPSPERLAKEGK